MRKLRDRFLKIPYIMVSSTMENVWESHDFKSVITLNVDKHAMSLEF